MNGSFAMLAWTGFAFLFWVAVAVLAVVRKDSGRWWTLVAAGAGLLAFLTLVDQVLWWTYVNSWSYDDHTLYSIVSGFLRLLDFVGLGLVAAGALTGRPGSGSKGITPPPYGSATPGTVAPNPYGNTAPGPAPSPGTATPPPPGPSAHGG